MIKTYHRGVINVNLDAIESNIAYIYGNQESGQIMMVIKADGYGHGANVIAKEYDTDERIWGFGVASAEEAMELRNIGINKSILVLGMVFPDQYEELIENGISLNVFTQRLATELLAVASKLQKVVSMHIKIDTGMSRLGASADLDTVQWIRKLCKNEWASVEGVFTHFATADEVDKSFTKKQYYDFMEVVTCLKEGQLEIPYYHCSNSAGAIEFPNYSMDMTRVGIAQYGLYPSDEVFQENVMLTPALSWKSVVSHVRTINVGDTISYGRSYEAKKPMVIATIPVGYADGYPRSLTNKAYVLINGKKANIVGKVCMDQFMVDITDIDDVEFMSEVTLIGRDGNKTIKVEDLSQLCDKFNYEFICGIGKRIPRNYIKSRKIVEQKDYFA